MDKAYRPIGRRIPHALHRTPGLWNCYLRHGISYSHRIFDDEQPESGVDCHCAGKPGAGSIGGPTVVTYPACVTYGSAHCRAVYQLAAAGETRRVGVASKGGLGTATCFVAPAEG